MGSSSYSSRCVEPWKSSAKLMTADKSSPERMDTLSLNMKIARNHAQADATRHTDFAQSGASIDLGEKRGGDATRARSQAEHGYGGKKSFAGGVSAGQSRPRPALLRFLARIRR